MVPHSQARREVDPIFYRRLRGKVGERCGRTASHRAFRNSPKAKRARGQPRRRPIVSERPRRRTHHPRPSDAEVFLRPVFTGRGDDRPIARAFALETWHDQDRHRRGVRGGLPVERPASLSKPIPRHSLRHPGDGHGPDRTCAGGKQRRCRRCIQPAASAASSKSRSSASAASPVSSRNSGTI